MPGVVIPVNVIMKHIKRVLLVIAVLISAAVVFRGPVYRALVEYRPVATRSDYPVTDSALVRYIEANSAGLEAPSIHEVVNTALSTTSARLHFTAAHNHKDPNKLINSGSAHCVGYASFFAATCNHILRKHNLQHAWHATPRVAKLYVLGVNVHPYFRSSFFKDHDFVTIENKSTGEVLAVDPVVSDYLFINRVSCKSGVR